MKQIVIELPDKLAEILEKTLAADEIDLFVNQAVLRQLEEFYAHLPAEQINVEDDQNNHEWTS